METKQGFFDPKMPYPLDRRFFKATSTEILAIPEKARFRGMEIYAIDEDKWYQFRDGVADINLVVSERGGGAGGPAIENRYLTIAAMLADQGNQTIGGIQFVLDASVDPLVDSGYAYYDYLGTIVGDLTDYYLQSVISGGGGSVKDFSIYEETFYVHEITGSDTNDGTTFDSPLQTVNQAVLLSDSTKSTAIVLMYDTYIDFTVDKDYITFFHIYDSDIYPDYWIDANVIISGYSILFRGICFSTSVGKSITVNSSAQRLQFHDCYNYELRLITNVTSQGPRFIRCSGSLNFDTDGVQNVEINGVGATDLYVYSETPVPPRLICSNTYIYLYGSNYSSLVLYNSVIRNASDLIMSSYLRLYNGSFLYVSGDINCATITNDYGSILDVAGIYLGGQTDLKHANNPLIEADLTTRQTITITDANATDPLVLNSFTKIVKVILDAALTIDWQPSAITGWGEGHVYLFEIIKNSNNGIDMSVARAALNVGYDDDIDPFFILNYITTTQARAIIQAVGFKATFGQFGAMYITDTNYVE